MIFLLSIFLIFVIGLFFLTRVLPYWLRRKVAKMQQQSGSQAQAGQQPLRHAAVNKKKITKDTGDYVDYEEITD